MNLYNEIDPKAAAWLRELIKRGLIPDGHVEERSITEINPHELSKYTQCHFFAGIGGWSLALRLAGWPDDLPVWTGSCPCQPFSIGNINRLGRDDPRHLWPAFFRIIKICRPSVIFGEQVDDAIPEGWLDEVFRDMEVEGYACAPFILPARAYGAEHWRDRIFWVADAGRQGRQGRKQLQCVSCGQETPFPQHGNPLADARRALAGDWSDLPVVDGLSIGMVRGICKGAGNAIVPQVAAEFIQAWSEVTA